MDKMSSSFDSIDIDIEFSRLQSPTGLFWLVVLQHLQPESRTRITRVLWRPGRGLHFNRFLCNPMIQIHPNPSLPLFLFPLTGFGQHALGTCQSTASSMKHTNKQKLDFQKFMFQHLF